MKRSTISGAASADIEEKVIEALHAALEEVDDDSPAGPLPAGPDTVLIGDGGLESLEFVTFAVALEENLLDHGWAVSVFDLMPRDLEACTAGQLAQRIAHALEARSR